MKHLRTAAVLVAMIAVPSLAQSPDDFAAKVINAPLPASLKVFGLPAPPPVVRVKGVDGGKALRVAISAADKDPWKISLSSATTQGVKKGDRLVLAFHARATGVAPGTKARIANASVQLAAAPYTGLFGQPVDVGETFEFLQVSGKADRDYGPGELSASLQLATGKQIFEFGPLFIIDLDRK